MDWQYAGLRCGAATAAIVGLLALPAWAQQAPETRIVAARGVATTLPIDGTVEAVKQATVAAQIAGRILETHGDAGQVVRQGDLLVRIDARESSEAVAAAQAALANAKLNYERSLDLQKQKFVSQAAVDKAKADYDAALAAAQAVRVAEGHARVVAPLSGVIAVRHAEQGEMAAPGKPLFTIYDPRGLRVVVHVPQARLTGVRAAKSAVVDFPGSAQRIESANIQVLPTVDIGTHAVEVRVVLPATASFAAPGMAARVLFAGGEASKLTVPKSALVRRGEMSAVYVKNSAGALVLRQLRLGATTADGEVEVLAGLVSGEEIALDAVKAAIAARAAPPARPR